jgi:3-oxoacyl-(acyl-carrier-protein) synthase
MPRPVAAERRLSLPRNRRAKEIAGLGSDHGVDATAAAFASYLGVEGLQVAVSTACSSGIVALATAARFIDHGLADAAVVGSADSLCRTTIFGFHGLGLLDSTATRPFAQERRGITLGEGSAYVLIERAGPESARHALGWLGGVGASSDAFHQTSPHPDGAGAEIAMRQALERAGLEPTDVDLVSAHATGTRLSDAVEGAALTRVFGAAVPVTATKSLTGHTLGSSGLTALVLALEALRPASFSTRGSGTFSSPRAPSCRLHRKICNPTIAYRRGRSMLRRWATAALIASRSTSPCGHLARGSGER